MRKEKREFTRLAMHTKANMVLEDQCIEGEVENLSFKGAFVVAERKLGLHQVVSITISNIPISAKAKVVRVTDEGMGLQFENNLLD